MGLERRDYKCLPTLFALPGLKAAINAATHTATVN
jgi:hypothetical protein